MCKWFIESYKFIVMVFSLVFVKFYGILFDIRWFFLFFVLEYGLVILGLGVKFSLRLVFVWILS